MNHTDAVTLLSALLVGLEAVIVSFLVWVVKKISAHDTALALLIQQVNPPGDKSLRMILGEIQIEAARYASSASRERTILAAAENIVKSD
jgi:hypothetical protein